MKTTATAVVWRRVLSVCLLCALWGEGTVRAVELSPQSSNAADWPPMTEGAVAAAAAAEALREQKTFVGTVGALTLTIGDLLEGAAEAAAGGGEAANKILAGVEKVAEIAQALDTTARAAREAVSEADGKTKDVAEKARGLAGGAPGVEVAREAVEAWRKEAGKVAELWEEASKKVASQLSTAEKVLTEAGNVQTAASNANNGKDAATATDEQKRKMEQLKNMLTGLPEYVREIKEKAERPKDLVHTAEEKMKLAAGMSSTQAAKEAAKENALKPPQQDPPAGLESSTTENDVVKPPTEGTETLPQVFSAEADKPTNDGSGNTATGAPTTDALKEDSSFDGSPLTVSRFAATSVLLLLAPVAAVMVTA